MRSLSLFFIFISIILLSLCISCSDDDDPVGPTKADLVGTWETVSIKADGVEVTPGDDPYNLLVNHGVYTFNADGTGSVIFTYDGSMDYTWSISGEYLVLGDGYRMKLTVQDKNTFSTYEPADAEAGYPAVLTVYERVISGS